MLMTGALGCLALLMTFSGAVRPACGQDGPRGIPSLGNGTYEVLIFADYFCPPCKRIDEKADSLLKKLVATGKVKLSFVDVPFNRVTPIYAKYYLYAANADSGINNILRVRNALFDAAQGRRIQDEKALVAFLTGKKITWKAMDEKSVFPLLSAAIKEHAVDHTPTCVIRYSATDVKRFVGPDAIWDGLTKLKAHLATLKKEKSGK